MEQKYSIDEILLAVNEIHEKKRETKKQNFNSTSSHKDYSAVPKSTLKLIEEAEKIKN